MEEMSKSIYLIGDDGGAAETNNLKAVELLKKHGYRECTRDEYEQRVVALEEAERREFSEGERQTDGKGV